MSYSALRLVVHGEAIAALPFAIKVRSERSSGTCAFFSSVLTMASRLETARNKPMNPSVLVMDTADLNGSGCKCVSSLDNFHHLAKEVDEKI